MSLKRKFATAFAPATVANVGVGFDILGFALDQLGEFVRVERLDRHREVVIDPIENYPGIPTDPQQNTAGAGLIRLIQEKQLRFGFRVQISKQIPVGSGLGGSSTSAVATLVAANALLPRALKTSEILDYALSGEEIASGSRHADNVGPCLQGGLVLVQTTPRLQIVPIKTPPRLRCVVLLPRTEIKTKEARAILRPELSLKTHIEQSANLAGFLVGLTQKNLHLVRESLNDVLIEPQRAGLIPHFYEFQQRALKAGALGCSISGSGPAIFALADGEASATKIQNSWRKMVREQKLEINGLWVSGLAKKGARLVTSQRC